MARHVHGAVKDAGNIDTVFYRFVNDVMRVFGILPLHGDSEHVFKSGDRPAGSRRGGCVLRLVFDELDIAFRLLPTPM